MEDNVIEVRDLGKKYVIRHQQERYNSLRDTIANKTKEILHPSTRIHTSKEEFWALQDINFDIKQGDRVGIIGRNGAGKSTLLKLLSRITEPTTGSIKVKGRVASLLEVGTGFHPELTGRENIYLNGAILGMSKEEIRKKFDEIVEFAGVEKFLDTPVKRYSSGMYVRLAFSVAAHLETEILIVDEVLAVGDTQFQEKCLGKMGSVASEGKTVLFVSHNMGIIKQLCNKGILLSQGKVNKIKDMEECIKFYMEEGMRGQKGQELEGKRRGGSGRLRIQQIWLEDSNENEIESIGMGEDAFLNIRYYANSSIRYPRIIIGVYDTLNLGITRFDTEITNTIFEQIPKEGVIRCHIKKMSLIAGIYSLNIAFYANGDLEDYILDGYRLSIEETNYLGSGRMFERNLAKVVFQHEWEIR